MQPKLLCIYFCYNQSLQKSICELLKTDSSLNHSSLTQHVKP